MNNTTLNTIVESINAMGFKAEVHEVSKNNTVMTGIIFRDNGNISPILYLDKFVTAVDNGTKLLSEVIDEIIELYKANKKPSIDVDKWFTPDYLYSHIFMAVQQHTAEDIIKNPTDYDGIEKYLYVKIDDSEIAGNDGMASFKLNYNLVKNYGLDIAYLWDKAEENTFKTCHYENFGMLPGMSMPILTNDSKVKGAVAMLDRDLIKSLGSNEVVILPSSIHEVIVMPTSQIEPEQIETLSAMVKEVNATEVAPEEVLSDKAYIVNVDSWTVKAIA